MRRYFVMIGIAIGLFLPSAVFAQTGCKHIVGCNDKTICLDCGVQLQEGDKYAEIMHVTDESLGGTCIKINDQVHKTTCACGEEINTEMHLVMCTSEDNRCTYCHEIIKGYHYIFAHEGEELKTGTKYHWRECVGCHELTMPKLRHYTTCLDQYNGKTSCSFCNRDDVVITEKNQGIHESFSELATDKHGRYIHQWYCIACKSVVKDKEEEKAHFAQLSYKNLKDGYHSVICACGTAFDDESHSWGEYKITKKATRKESGVRTRFCKYCNAKKNKKINRIKSVALRRTSYAYDGKKKTPKVIIRDSKGNKISASYFTVTYPKNRKNVGRYQVTIQMKGAYSGRFVRSFRIKK